MANDLTFGMDVVIDKILGLGQFDALGKKLQNVVAKAIQAGLLEGVPEAREMLRQVYGTSTVAGRDSAIKRLYAHSARVEERAKKAEARLEEEARKRQITTEEQIRRRKIRRAERLAELSDYIAEAREELETYEPESYSATRLLVQASNVLTRRSNRKIVGRDNALSYTENEFYLRELGKQQAKEQRALLPWIVAAQEKKAADAAQKIYENRIRTRTELEIQDRMARAEYESEHGAVSDRTWRVLSAQEAFGANRNQAAWERGARRDAALEAERNAQRRKESAYNVSVFGEIADEAETAAAELEALGKTAKITGLLFSGISAGATMYYQSKWAQDAARNVTASNMAYYQRWESGGQIAGGAIGAIAGALIGGPIGAIIGATGLGGLAGLWGNYKQKELEGVLKTVATTTGARRDYLMFRGTSGFSMGQAMEDAGFGTASDLNNMRWTSQTLPGAMALGMVGEQDMLMLSLMPEYFAALMGGADAATLAAAYQKSVQNLPVQLRPLVATMAPGGSQGMYVNAIDPQFNNFLGYSHDMVLKDRYFTAVSEQTMAGSIMRSQMNLALAHAGVAENYAQALQGKHGDYFDMSYISPMSGWAQTMTLMGANAPLSAKGAEEFFAQTTQMLNNEHFMTAIDGLSRFAENGLNLVIRIEGLGDITQSFPFGALADGQSVEFNIGAQ